MPQIEAIITGASRGIGLATATHLAAHHPSTTTLLLIARDAPRLAATATRLAHGHPQTRVHQLAGDVACSEFWTGAFAARVEELDMVPNVLVNAAGVAGGGVAVRRDVRDFQTVLRTNLEGSAMACGAVGRMMLRQARRRPAAEEPPGESGSGSGRRRSRCIVNVSSILAMRGGKGCAAYAASKAGVLGLTQGLAAELGTAGIRVNVVVPGYVETDMTKETFSHVAKELIRARIPLGRFGTADEVADAIAFLINNEYANNCVLNLDGGLSATL